MSQAAEGGPALGESCYSREGEIRSALQPSAEAPVLTYYDNIWVICKLVSCDVSRHTWTVVAAYNFLLNILN